MEKDIKSLYKKIDENFYHDQTVSKNPLRKWFHLNRYKIANSLVKSRYEEGNKIVDLGCGSVDWNTENLDIFGVDLNENLLKIAKQKGRLSNYKLSEASNTGLPDEFCDIIVSFEFLEHVEDYEKIIEESKRILKKGGHCIISVPLDILFSLWKPLFFLQVLFQGYIIQNPYYKNRCGHINHFSIESIKNAFLKHGYKINLVFTMRRFTIFLCAQKEATNFTPTKSYEDTTIILPTLNEGKNIFNILTYIITNYKGCKIIVADDGSKDETKKNALSFKYKGLLFLDRSNQEIHGLTISVLDAAELVETKYFVVIDADGQHPPEKIKEIVNILRFGDKLVIASRIAVEKNWGLCRKIISYSGTFIGKISLLLRGKRYVSFDILGGFFGCDSMLWNKSISNRFKKEHFRLRGYKVLFDFLKYAPPELKIEEIYYIFETRKSEVSKINLKVHSEFLKSCFLP